MQSTNIPSKIPLPFGYAAGSSYINPIPAASQIGINDGRASLHDGFPPDTFTPVAAGGIPPFGGDFNGILNEITSITQWQEAGGFFVYDATFSTAVGGYPKGAILQSTSFDGLWTSSVENNTSNPDANGAGWTPTAFNNLKSIALSGSSVTLTQVQAAYPILIFTGTLTANCTVNIPAQVGKWIVVNRTTGSFTVQFKTPSGTGVYAPQGYAVYTYGDATNIYYVSSGFSTQEGYLTATQGQTVFPLTGFNYVPNTNNIAIFVNGSKQLSGVNFSETSSTAITFVSGLNAGDIVEFVIGASFGSPSMWSSNVYYNEQGTGAVTRTLESKLQEIISVTDFGAVCDGITDDSTALFNANSAATASNSPLFINGPMYIGTATSITALIVDTVSQLFTSASLVTITKNQIVRPEWWGADYTGTNDSYSAFNAMFTTFKTGTVQLSGKYKFLTSLVVTGALGLKVIGTGSYLDDSGSVTNNCVLNFDAVAASSNGLVFTGFNNLVLEDFFISFNSGGAGGGTALDLHAGFDFKIESVNVSITRGNQGNGIGLGQGTGPTTAFMGLISKCRVTNFSNGVTFGSFGQNTSLTFQNCYGGRGYYFISQTQYSSLINCASDASAANVLANTGYGYVIDNSNTLSLINCGGEGNAKSAFHVQNLSNNIEFFGPYGAANNQTDQTQGDVISFDSTAGFLRSIEVHTPKSIVPMTGTTSNISETGNQTELTIYGYSYISLPLGVSGNTVWEHAFLTINGNPEVMTFTPTLVGWTNSGTPTVVGNYIKNDRLVNFTVTITPSSGGSVAATLGASKVTLPFDIVVDGICSQVTGTASNGNAFISSVGTTIYVQSTGTVSSGEVILSGFLMQ